MIAHLDLDAFFAAVELHRRPELRGRPLVVGGDPRSRGVVATASYAARAFGIRSAMSCAEAERRCPDVVFVPPDIAEYRRWSRRVWALVAELSPCVEQVGIDEGYLVLDDPAPEHAARIRQAVRDEIRLSCSLGVASCKVVAKIASDRDKPGGLTVVPEGEEATFLAPLDVRLLPGVGPKTQERLAEAGIRTIGALAGLADDALDRLVGGVVGRDLRARANGIDPRPVLSEPAERISISTERTFDVDRSDVDELGAMLVSWAEGLAEDLARRGKVARTVNLKLRYPDFSTVTRGHTVVAATGDPRLIGAVGLDLLARALADRPPPIRLLGLGVAGLVADLQLALF